MATLHTSKLSAALERHADISEQKLNRRHPAAAAWFKKRGIRPRHMRHHAAHMATSAALAGVMLLSNPLVGKVSSESGKFASLSRDQLQNIFAANLKNLLPTAIHPLTHEEEDAISKLIGATWGIRAAASLEGERLNTSYGIIGAEQHLPRYPGDSVLEHNEYQESGITPGRGAWGYFANSRGEMTDDLIQKEKYYVAVQTLYLPDWTERLSSLREWYKYRKVLVMNPANGKIIVADIADAGPAKFTGKHFGGSPEVMAYLEAKDGAQKGPIVLFFVDDPDNKIPLGPVERSIL